MEKEERQFCFGQTLVFSHHKTTALPTPFQPIQVKEGRGQSQLEHKGRADRFAFLTTPAKHARLQEAGKSPAA